VEGEEEVCCGHPLLMRERVRSAAGGGVRCPL
jgi:hypothetical protein